MISHIAEALGYRIDAEDVRKRLAALPATHVVFVAFDKARPVGWLHAYASHSILHGERVEIAGLAVAADRQGHGIGTALITRLEEWTRGRGIGAIRVLSGAERDAAHTFYRNRGYRQVKIEKVFAKSLLRDRSAPPASAGSS
jgi:GNAT superfamily N-acetyltransferase